MGLQRDDQWGKSAQVFTDAQVLAVLQELGIEVRGETERVFLAGCPFHFNPGSPAFAVNRESGLYYCHNPSCGVKGRLEQLIATINNVNHMQAMSLLNKYHQEIDYAALIEKQLDPVEFKEFDRSMLDRLERNFPSSEGEEYMLGRGFTHETLREFNIGFSKVRQSVIVPVHTDQAVPIGFVARSIHGKRFQNSEGLPKSKSAFNIHRAKRAGGTIIVCESSFDAMRIHQAGYPNVIALLGGSLSKYTQEQLERYASTIVIMTDNDFPGRKLGEQIEAKVRRKILWASDGPEVYPHDAKDACDLTDNEIRHLLSNAVSSMEYHSWTDQMV